MNCELLIKYIQIHKELYDTSNCKYGDNQRKEVIWKMIGEKLNQPGVNCKKTWALMRDSFRRVQRRRRLEEGQPGKKMRKWKYEDEMAFLVPHLTERKSSTNTTDVYVSDFECPFSDEEKKALESTSVNEDDSSQSSSKERKRSREQNETNESDEVVDAFFASISRTVKTFNPYLQNIAKSKVFSIVSELELEQIKQNERESGNPPFVHCIVPPNNSFESSICSIKEESN